MGPCFGQHFGVGEDMGFCASWEGHVDSLFSSAKNCLAALALSWILMKGEGWKLT